MLQRALETPPRIRGSDEREWDRLEIRSESKTETAPVPILEAMDVSMSAVTELIERERPRTESLSLTPWYHTGRQRRGRTPASITTEYLP